MIDFNKYSIALVKEHKIIYISNEKRLKPLFDLINKFKLKECTLYDRVIGLAAAKLIVYSKMISEVITPIASKGAVELLKENNIKITPEKIVEKIDCIMEEKARDIEDTEEFYNKLKETFK